MSGFPIVDLVIGLIFIFFMLSIITSSLVEIVMSRMKVRNHFLKKWLLTIFDKNITQPDGNVITLGQAIMDHCLTTALAKPGKATSYMDGKNFVSALIEKVTYDHSDPSATVASLDDLLNKINKATAKDGSSMLSTELRRAILMFGQEAKITADAAGSKTAFEVFREKVENWFDTSMDRVGGKMKSKYIRPITFFLGLIVVVCLNADTVKISRYLYDHKEAAKEFADKASAIIPTIDTSTRNPEALKKLNENIAILKDSAPQDMPLGWKDNEINLNNWWKVCGEHWVGWLATLMAIMLGAPFWFDLLNKIANIRSAGAKPQTTTDKKDA